MVGFANGIYTAALRLVLAHMVCGAAFRPATGSCCAKAAVRNQRCHSDHYEADDYHDDDGLHTDYLTSADSGNRSSIRPIVIVVRS